MPRAHSGIDGSDRPRRRYRCSEEQMSTDRDIRICVCTTVSVTIRAFYGEQLRFLQENGFQVTVLTSPDEQLAGELPAGVSYRPVEMTRGVTPWADLRALWSIWRTMRA